MQSGLINVAGCFGCTYPVKEQAWGCGDITWWGGTQMAGSCSSQLRSLWVLLQILEETSSIWAVTSPPSGINAFTDGVFQGVLTFVCITEQPPGKCVHGLWLKRTINDKFFQWAKVSAPAVHAISLPGALVDEGLWDMFVKDIPRSATSYTVGLDKLKQGVTYEFRVVAVNEFGYGEPSIPSVAVSGKHGFFKIFSNRISWGWEGERRNKYTNPNSLVATNNQGQLVLG